MRRNKLILILIVLAIFLFVHMNSYVEGFTPVNPIPTYADLQSIGTISSRGITGTPSPTMQKVIDFIKNYKWSRPLKPNEEFDIVSSINIIYFYVASYESLSNLIASYTTRPSFEQVVKDVNKLNKKDPIPDDTITNFIQNSQNSTNISTQSGYAAYIYVFGDASSGPTSSTTFVIPPCKRTTRSIPGGYLETNCFDVN